MNIARFLGATLKAVAGLNWTAGTQVPVLTGASTAQLLTVGTGASAIPQRDASGNMPSPYPSTPWSYEWLAANGSPLSNGWTNSGAVSATVAAYNHLGVDCYSITPSGSTGTSFIKRAVGFAATGSFTIQAKIALPASGTGTSATPRHALLYCPDTTSASSTRMEFGITSSAVTYWSGTSGLTGISPIGNHLSKWMDLTIHVFKAAGANTISQYFIQVSLGVMTFPAFQMSSAGAISGFSAGDAVLGRMSTAADTSPIYIAAFRMHDGIHPAPVSYAFSGNVWPL